MKRLTKRSAPPIPIFRFVDHLGTKDVLTCKSGRWVTAFYRTWRRE